MVSSNASLDRIFHSLSDRTRREVLRRLSEGPASVGELAAPFQMSRVAVSKHLILGGRRFNYAQGGWTRAPLFVGDHRLAEC